MAGSYGTFAKWEMNDVRYDFHPSSMMGVKEEHVNTNGIRGDMDDSIERNLPGIKRVNGQIRLFPTPTELTTILPVIFGTAVSGITYALADTLTGYTHNVDRVGKVHAYASAKTVRNRFHCGGHNQALGLDLDVLGIAETEGAAGTFSSTDIDVATKPWMFHQGAFTVDGTTVTPANWESTVDWMPDTERFFNAQTLSAINLMGRRLTMSMLLPYGDSTGIYTSSLLNTGVQVVATFTNGVYILTMTFVKVAFEKRAPEINQKTGEMMLPIVGVAMKSSTTRPLVTTLAIS